MIDMAMAIITLVHIVLMIVMGACIIIIATILFRDFTAMGKDIVNGIRGWLNE